MAKTTPKLVRAALPRGSDAFSLMQLIGQIEGKSFVFGSENIADRKWVLDTYRECRFAVAGKEPPQAVHLTIVTSEDDLPQTKARA